MKRLALLVVLVAMTGCGSKEQQFISGAERLVASKLKDPDSAQFGQSYFVKSADSNKDFTKGWVCGEVNGKNSFGAYAGPQRFVVRVSYGLGALDFQAPVIEDAMKALRDSEGKTSFEKVYWDEECANGSAGSQK